MNENSRTAAGFLLGLSIGVGLGVLFAPRSGRAMRRAVRNAAEDGLQYAERKGRHLRTLAEDLVDDGRELFERQKDRVASVLKP